MFRVSLLVFEAVLAELSPFLNDGTSRNHQQNIPPIKLYNKLYPLGKIVCPRCKKQSNGAMTSKDGCPCFAQPLVSLASGALLARQPTLREYVKSPGPYTRRETYRRLLFSIKPADFNLECD